MSYPRLATSTRWLKWHIPRLNILHFFMFLPLFIAFRNQTLHITHIQTLADSATSESQTEQSTRGSFMKITAMHSWRLILIVYTRAIISHWLMYIPHNPMKQQAQYSIAVFGTYPSLSSSGYEHMVGNLFGSDKDKTTVILYIFTIDLWTLWVYDERTRSSEREKNTRTGGAAASSKS